MALVEQMESAQHRTLHQENVPARKSMLAMAAESDTTPLQAQTCARGVRGHFTKKRKFDKNEEKQCEIGLKRQNRG